MSLLNKYTTPGASVFINDMVRIILCEFFFLSEAIRSIAVLNKSKRKIIGTRTAVNLKISKIK